MSTTHWQKIYYELAEMKRRMAHMMRPMTVADVKDDKIRMQVGTDAMGQPILGPWIHNSSHRATGGDGYTERKIWRKGMSVMTLNPHGDPLGGIVLPYSPTVDHPPPNHVEEAGPDAHTHQIGALHVTQHKDYYDMFLNDDTMPEAQPMPMASGQREDDQAKPKAKAGPPNLTMRVYKKGGVTGWCKEGDIRFSAVPGKGAKVKAGKHYAVATPTKLIVSEPPLIEADSVPDDDMTKLPATSGGGGGQ
jgi:hypothetical protein